MRFRGNGRAAVSGSCGAAAVARSPRCPAASVGASVVRFVAGCRGAPSLPLPVAPGLGLAPLA
eukprot:15447018-Alexandrium_andersonii.AAC.1